MGYNAHMQTYTYPAAYNVTAVSHRHYWTLALRNGQVIAQCACGAVLDYVEILDRLNKREAE